MQPQPFKPSLILPRGEQAFNPGRREMNRICREKGITRKRFRALQKQFKRIAREKTLTIGGSNA